MNKATNNPPKTRLVFNIGITGHRYLPSSDTDLLNERIETIFKTVKASVNDCFNKTQSIHTGEEPVIRLISMLAEGSDRIAAKNALKAGFRLQCPLPLSLNEYEKDFETEASKKEFRQLLDKADSIFEIEACSRNRSRAYQNGGQVLLSHSDILLAIWDYADSGKVGGTSDIVSLARQQDIPVICIASASPHEISIIYGSSGLHESEKLDTGLNNIISHILVPQMEAENIGGRTGKKLKAQPLTPEVYFREDLSKKSRAKLYSLTKRLFSYSKKTKALETAPEEKEIENEFYNKHYSSHFNSADELAKHYRDLYRSSGIIRNLLPLIASLGLALGFYTKLFGGPGWSSEGANLQTLIINTISIIGFFIQALCFILIIALSDIEKRYKWQTKFSDYRALSEMLRQMRYLGPAGLVLGGLRSPSYYAAANTSWINWHFRSIVREAGLPSMKVSEEVLKEYITYIDKSTLQEQIAYHTDNQNTMELIAKRINKYGIFIYYMGVVLVALRFLAVIITSNQHLLPLAKSYRDYISTFFNMFSMVIPLFSAFLFGMSSQEGFERMGQMSKTMKDRLSAHRSEIQRGLQDYNAFMKYAQSTAEIMLSEFTDWNTYFSTKKINKT
jgi:hypothetical protein